MSVSLARRRGTSSASARDDAAQITRSREARARTASNGLHKPMESARRSIKEPVVEKAPETSIRVVVRIRPKLSKEVSEKDGVKAPVGGSTIVLSNGQEQKQFSVDDVFDSRNGAATQTRIFNQFGRDLVLESLKGYNVCIFAYGHTGSGKTYTMLGDGDEAADVQGEGAGLLPRFLHEICKTHANDPRRQGMRYSCEFYEVYNEQIRDLLAPNNAERKRKVHVHPKHGVRIDGSTPSLVTSAEEALDLVNFGNQMRTVATTTMNERSSRSHAVVIFKFAHLGQVGDDVEAPPLAYVGNGLDAIASAENTSVIPFCESTLTFVDLAGREDQHASSNEAVQFREMCFINTSLFHLANVIHKLAEGQVDNGSLADFRNSKLTLLLSQALVGNSRTALVATVAPLQCYFDDSIHTLTFAQSVKKIHTCAVVNNKGSGSVVKELEYEVQQLRKELSQSQTNATEKEQGLLAAEALIDYYKRSYEDAMSHSNQMKKARSRLCMTLGFSDPADKMVVHSPKAPAGALLPFFTKLSDDPSLQGCCNYLVKKATLRIGSCEQTCDIVLRGLGIAPSMCEVRQDSDDGCVYVEVLDAGSYAPRVLVNGEPVVHGMGARPMEHGHSIMLGYAHAFRLVKPTVAEVTSLGTTSLRILARSTISKLDMESVLSEIVDETGIQFKEVYPFLQQLSSHVPESAVNAFVKQLHCICPLIDEANLITKEVFGKEELRFQLYTLANPFAFGCDMPEFAVCLFQLPKSQNKSTVDRRVDTKQFHARYEDPGTPSGSWKARHPLLHNLGFAQSMTLDGQELLYVWSLEKFLRRLNEIREIYQEGAEARDCFASVWQQLSKKPFMNPWRELRFADVKFFAEDIGRYVRTIKGADDHGITRPEIQDPLLSACISEGVQELVASAFVSEEDFSSPSQSGLGHRMSAMKLDVVEKPSQKANVPRWSAMSQQQQDSPQHQVPEIQIPESESADASVPSSPSARTQDVTSAGDSHGKDISQVLKSIPKSWSDSQRGSLASQDSPVVPALRLVRGSSPTPPPSPASIDRFFGRSTDDVELAALDKVRRDINDIRQRLSCQHYNIHESESAGDRLGDLLNRLEGLLQNLPAALADGFFWHQPPSVTPPIPVLTSHRGIGAWSPSHILPSSVTVPRASSPGPPRRPPIVGATSARGNRSPQTYGRWSIGCPGQGMHLSPTVRPDTLTPRVSSIQSGIATPLSARASTATYVQGCKENTPRIAQSRRCSSPPPPPTPVETPRLRAAQAKMVKSKASSPTLVAGSGAVHRWMAVPM